MKNILNILSIVFASNFTGIGQTVALSDTTFKIGDKLPLRPIYFDLAKSNIVIESYPYLDSISDFLLKNDNLSLEVGVHTDTRGISNSSTCLSCNRAKAIVNYLISQGVHHERLYSKGYNDNEPIISDEEINKLKTNEEKEKAHQINRRVEFRIVRSDDTLRKNNDTIQVIAKLISPGEGSKIHIANYEAIKVIKGKLTNDTIKVGYYFHNEYQNALDTAMLNLTTYTGDVKMTDHYIFPDYDSKRGIEKVRISFVDLDYWEGCETGKEDCKPLTLIRSSNDENWFLFMPCGGTATTVTLSKQMGYPEDNRVIQKCQISYANCPPAFDLTNLEDGKYFASMLACGLGGQIEINLTTKD